MTDIQAHHLPTNVRKRERLVDIERCKGLGILLVVYGHLVMPGTFGSQAWYDSSQSVVYLFHMAFFMYLSGFVFFYTESHEALGKDFSGYALKKVDRLLIPFFFFGFAIVVGKELAGRVMHVDQSVQSFWSGILSVFTNAPQNPSISIWYLIVLFVYSIFTPLLWRLTRRSVTILFALSMCLFLYARLNSELFYLNRVISYYAFFVAGMLCCRHRDIILPFISRHIVTLGLIACCVLFVGRSQAYWLLACGLAAIPVLHAFMRLPVFENERVFLWLGQNSMAIYLMNTIFIGVMKGLYAKALPFEGAWFPVFVLVLMAAGTLLPVAVKQLLEQIPSARPVYKYLR